MGYTVVDAADVEPRNGTFRQMRKALGATAFGINQFELPPNQAGFEHDETAANQEEVYVFLSGSGVLKVDGEEVEARPGRWVRVDAEAVRQPVAGPDGLSWICVGNVVGGSYTVREPF